MDSAQDSGGRRGPQAKLGRPLIDITPYIIHDNDHDDHH